MGKSIGCKIKTIDIETNREIKFDIFVSPFTEFVKLNINYGDNTFR
jgi:hypothetical protein